MRAIMGYEAPMVSPPKDYKGDFFKGYTQQCTLLQVTRIGWRIVLPNQKTIRISVFR